MAQQYKVTNDTTLLPFLFERLEGWSKKTIKQKLQSGSIFVNNQSQTKHNFMIEDGDIVHIGAINKPNSHTNLKLEILHQDKDVIAIYKPAGLLSVGTNKETKNHALALLRSQLSRGKKAQNIRLWPVHRLDRETSGVLLFATSKETREEIMDRWIDTKKTYLAVVKGQMKIPKDTITQPLRIDDKEYKMIVGNHPNAKVAITHYELKKSSKTNSLLEVTIDTGRQHQIRAHLSWLGNPIIGDERYGTKGNRMGLHSLSLEFIHPKTKEIINLQKDAPSDFYNLL